MEALVNEVVVSDEELARYRNEYTKAVREGTEVENVRFGYAWALVCTSNRRNINEGIEHLKDMLKNSKSHETTRTYLYYLAVASAKMKDYRDSLNYIEALKRVDPNNSQMRQLEALVNKRIERDGAVGAAVVGGAAVMGLAGIVGLGVLLAKGLKK